MMSDKLVFVHGLHEIYPSKISNWFSSCRYPFPLRSNDVLIDKLRLTREPLNIYVPKQIWDSEYPLHYRTDDLLEILLERSLKLLNSDRKLAVFWSGGLASSIALASLIRACEQTNHSLDCINVFLNYQSINQNYEFYNKFIVNKVKLYNSEIDFDIPFTDPEWCFVNTSGLTQTIGSEQYNYLRHTDLKPTDKMTYSVWHTWMQGKEQFESQSDWYWEFFRSHANKFSKLCSRSVTSVADFYWYLSFVFRYQSSALRILSLVGSHTNPQFIYNNLELFYADMDIQNWAIYNTHSSFDHRSEIWKLYTRVAGTQLKRPIVRRSIDQTLRKLIKPIGAISTSMEHVQSLMKYYVPGNDYSDLPELIKENT